MPHYLFTADFSPEGLAAVMTETAARRLDVVTHAVETLGGRVVNAFWSNGAHDFYLITEFDDHVSAVAFANRVSASGLGHIGLEPLLTAAEFDGAAIRGMDWSPPTR